jgi:YcxB-like protein
MKVNANISKMDLIRFNFAVLPKLKSTYVCILVFAVFAFCYICWTDGIPQTANKWMVVSISSLAGGVISMLFGLIFSTIFILLMSSSQNGTLGEHEYTLSTEGLHEKTSANEGLNKWQGISKVKVAGSYLLFQITGYLFHIIPERSFESKEVFQEYVGIATEYWQNAHSKRVN